MNDELRCPHGLAEVDPDTGDGCGACQIERAHADEEAEHKRRLAEAAENGMTLRVLGPRGSRKYYYDHRVDVPESLLSVGLDCAYVWSLENAPDRSRDETISTLEKLAVWAAEQAERLKR